MKKNRIVALFLTLAMMFSLCATAATDEGKASSSAINTNHSMQNTATVDFDNEFIEIFSYKTILRSRYDSKTLSGAIDPSELSFDEFCSSYVEPNLVLDRVTVDNVKLYQEAIASGAQPYSSSSGDEKYILKGINDPASSSFDPSYTPSSAFQRAVEYEDRSLYSLLQEGDIILETNCTSSLFGGAVNNIGHTAYIYNVAKSGIYGSYIQTIEAVGGGIQFGFLDDNRMITFGVVVLRPVNTSQGNC